MSENKKISKYQAKAQAGDARAQHKLAELYFDEQEEQALYWLNKSAEQDYVPALLDLASLAENRGDLHSCILNLIKAASLRNQNAANALGDIYLREKSDIKTFIRDNTPTRLFQSISSFKRGDDRVYLGGYERFRDRFYGYLIGIVCGCAFGYGSCAHVAEEWPELGIGKYFIGVIVGIAFFFLTRKGKLKHNT